MVAFMNACNCRDCRRARVKRKTTAAQRMYAGLFAVVLSLFALAYVVTVTP